MEAQTSVRGFAFSDVSMGKVLHGLGLRDEPGGQIPARFCRPCSGQPISTLMWNRNRINLSILHYWKTSWSAVFCIGSSLNSDVKSVLSVREGI